MRKPRDLGPKARLFWPYKLVHRFIVLGIAFL